MSFGEELEAASKRTIDHVEQVFKASAFKVWSEIIIASPVGNPDLWIYNKGTKEDPEYVDYIGYLGREALNGYTGGSFRANWQVTTLAPAVKALKGKDKTGTKALAKGTKKILGAENPTQFYFTNNLPYAARLEYEGWSTQMEVGTVRSIANRFDSYVAQNNR